MDDAIDRPKEAFRRSDPMLRDLKADPHWDRMRDHHRFQALARRMAFPEFPGR